MKIKSKSTCMSNFHTQVNTNLQLCLKVQLRKQLFMYVPPGKLIAANNGGLIIDLFFSLV